MPPVKAGAGYLCLLASVILGFAPSASLWAQSTSDPPATLETQQQVNDRIGELSAKSRVPFNPHDYTIGRGDVVVVEVFDVPELTRELRVSQTGTIGLPLLPVRLYVAGLTEIQAQQKIAEVLEANGLVTHAMVMVSVREKRSRRIAVVGAVVHPMVYQADHSVTLIEVLAEAGGIAVDAGDTIIVTRGGTLQNVDSSEPPEISPADVAPVGNPTSHSPQPSAEPSDPPQNVNPVSSLAPQPPVTQNSRSAPTQTPTTQDTASAAPPPVAAGDAPAPVASTITVNLAQLLEKGDTSNNIPLLAGDVVTVPHAGIIYALGGVNRPGGYVANNDRAQLSTLKLLALAGGTTRISRKSQAVIIRKDSSGKQIQIPVDLAKIVKRQAEDVRLLPSDILYVPESGGKAALLRAAEIGVGLGTGLLIYRLGT